MCAPVNMKQHTFFKLDKAKMTTKKMKQLKAWLSIALTLCSSLTCYSLHARGETRLENVAAHLGEETESEQTQDLDEEPIAPLKEEEKIEEPVLAINGDVRAEWQYINEFGVNAPSFEEQFGPFEPGEHRQCPRNETIRPSNPNCGNPRTCRGPLAANDIDIDLNLYFEFRTPCCWAVAHIEFDNDGGVRGSRKICGFNNCNKGSCKKGICKDSFNEKRKNCDKCTPPRNGLPTECCNRVNYDSCGAIDCQAPVGSGDYEAIALRKAFFGYNIWTHCKSRLDIEAGRRRLFDVFDSRIQFLSQFDGITLRYTNQFNGTGTTDFYWNAAGFVVNEHIDHFAFVTEVGFLNIRESGLDLKYSIIDWYKPGNNECCVPKSDGWRFINSQVTAGYKFNRDYFPVRVKLYGAVLYNHAARPRFYTGMKKYPWAGYFGILIGEVIEAGDWSIDMNVQYVDPQAVADADLTGFGRGNNRGETLTMAAGLRHFTPEERAYATQNARGNTNYKGFKIEGLYALTDYLSIDAQFIHSEAAHAKVGGRHRYNKFKVEGIFAF